MPAGTIKFSFTIGVQHTQSYRTTSAAVCRGSSCKEVTRELIASTNGERDGNSVSGAVGVTAGDKLEVKKQQPQLPQRRGVSHASAS